MVCGCSTQQHSKDSGCRLDNEPGSREFPTSFEGRGTSLDAIQDTASKCQRINIPFTHSSWKGDYSQHRNVSLAKNVSVAEAVYPGAPLTLDG
jgi:hypothetical protein